jgi:2,3-bisphosphoglycerate-dependent phosphoglycerate mutase
VRHGQSDWNLKNLFTGWRDVGLTEQGIAEAKAAGKLLKKKGLGFDIAYTSALSRAQDTLTLMLKELGQEKLKTIKDQALNERDYGDLTGLNKDDARKKWGEDQVHVWRRSYDVAPPGGESLKDTLARALPYYMIHIQPDVLAGKTVLVSAHGNSLRALIMVLEGLSPKQIVERELATGVPIVYPLGSDSRPTSVEILKG